MLVLSDEQKLLIAVGMVLVIIAAFAGAAVMWLDERAQLAVIQEELRSGNCSRFVTPQKYVTGGYQAGYEYVG